MGDVSSVENQTSTQGIEKPPKKSAGEIADEVLRKRELFKRYQERLSAETDAGNVADKIAEAGARRELEETQSTEAPTQPIPRKTHKPDISDAPTPPLPDNPMPSKEPKTFTQKLKNTASNIAWNTRLGFTMLAQLGGLHPWRSEGKWVWVLEPWARVHDDPRQKGYTDESDFYRDRFNASKTRLLNLPSMGLKTPSITMDGFGGIQLLDHRRILEAQRAGEDGKGKAIIVKPVNFHGLPKSFN
jgi:hypothetical protein